MHRYALLDSAVLEGHRHFGLMHSELSESLFMGKTGELMDSVAPYLVKMKNEKNFMTWFVHTGLYKLAGVIVTTDADFDHLHHHFRKFLYVKTEEGQKLYFRFYDPRVLPTFLRTCDLEQLEAFFGPVKTFALIDKEEKVLLFEFDGKKLIETSDVFDPDHFPLDVKIIYGIEAS